MDNKWKIGITVLSALATGVATYYWLQNVREEQTSFAVYQAKVDIVADDTEFSADVVETVRFPEEYRDLMSGSVIEASEGSITALQGTVFTRSVRAGGLLLYEHLETNPQGELSSRLEPGKRAITIPVNAPSTVGYFVEPGSLVDVIGTVAIPVTEPVASGLVPVTTIKVSTVTLLQVVRVLAVGGAVDPRDYRREAQSGYNTVTIEVTPDEAEKLVFAMQQVQGGLTLSLRSPDDEQPVATPSVSWENWNAELTVGDNAQ